MFFSQVKKLGMFATARSIVRVEGIGGLYRGIKPAIARHIPYTGTRVMLYDFLRTKIVGDQPLGKDGKKPGSTQGRIDQLHPHQGHCKVH